MILHSLPEKNPSSHVNQRATYYILAAAQIYMQLLQGQAVSASWSTLQKSDPCCCFCKLIEVSSVYGGPGSAKTVDLTSPLIHWPEYGDRSPTGMWALPHLSFPCCCLTGAAEGLILLDNITGFVSDCVLLLLYCLHIFPS